MEETESASLLAKVGKVVDHVNVTIGPRFLELFSEHLYSSPNKAFEELVSNSWDAGADTVYIGLPENPSDPSANIWVLDNGESMDVDGLRALWEVARSRKRLAEPTNGRPQIGKFGVGKLATYILANELTYICKAADGIIRAITMNYQRIDGEAGKDELHINPIQLDVRVLNFEELRDLLRDLGASANIMGLIEQGVPKPLHTNGWEDEFGEIIGPVQTKRDTWTLVLMTHLKQDGKEIQLGRTRWLLRSTLPFGSSMYIVFNGEILTSSKSDIDIAAEWTLGTGNLGIASIILPNEESRQVTEYSTPYPHICIEGIEGKITGRVRLYKDKISGGKSDMFGSSNGFFININGRVINPLEPYFGLENLNHASWAKFRATIRADGLDKHLEVNREGLLHGPDLDFIRGFLRMLFNKARSAHDAARAAAWPKVGEVLVDKWGLVPLEPLQKVVIDGLTSNSGVPGFVDITNVADSETTLREWKETSTSQPGDFIKDITLEQLPPENSFAKYDLGKRSIVVNSNHPFSREHSETHEQQMLLRDIALVDLLTEAYMTDIGIHEELIDQIRDHRDQLLRLVAQISRRTGAQIAEMLLNATDHPKGLERIVGDALQYLGFIVLPLGQPGQPEGVAKAPITPTKDDKQVSYSFTYDAKSAIKGKSKTGNLNIAGLARHRENYNADHTLVVAPDYETGALQQECRSHSVTPMRAQDLAALLLLTAAAGPLDLKEFRSVFQLADPDEVHEWLEKFSEITKSRRKLTFDVFLRALEAIGYSGPDALTTSVIADRIRQLPDISSSSTRTDVSQLIYGLAVLVPNLISISGDNVMLSTNPQKLRQAILAQISNIPSRYLFGMDQTLRRE